MKNYYRSSGLFWGTAGIIWGVILGGAGLQILDSAGGIALVVGGVIFITAGVKSVRYWI